MEPVGCLEGDMVVAALLSASAPPVQEGTTWWQVHGDIHLTAHGRVGVGQEQGWR